VPCSWAALVASPSTWTSPGEGCPLHARLAHVSAVRVPRLVTAWLSTSTAWSNQRLSRLGCASSSLSKQSRNLPSPSQQESFFDLGSGLVALPIWHLLSPQYIFCLHFWRPVRVGNPTAWFPPPVPFITEDLLVSSKSNPLHLLLPCSLEGLYPPTPASALPVFYFSLLSPHHCKAPLILQTCLAAVRPASAVLPQQQAAQEGLHGWRNTGLCSSLEPGLLALCGAVTAKAPSLLRTDHRHLRVLSVPLPRTQKPFWEAV